MRFIKILIIFLIITSQGYLSQKNAEDYLRNAKSYFWLSRSRNNAVYEAQTALKYLDSCKVLNNQNKGSQKFKSIETEISKMRLELSALIEVSLDNINGRYPIFMHLNRDLQDQYELRDDALETSIESGIQNLLDANNNKTNKPLSDLVTYCTVKFEFEVPFEGDVAVLREVAKQYLANYSKMYVVTQDEEYIISKGEEYNDSIIQEFGKAFNTNTFGVLKITLKDISSPLKYIGVGFEYFDTDKSKLISSTYVESFKEDKNNWLNPSDFSLGQFFTLVLFLLFPIIAWFIYRKKDSKINGVKDILPSISSSFVGLLFGIASFYLGIYILSFLSPGSDGFIGDPISIIWPFVFTFLIFIVLPQVLFLSLPLLSEKYFLKNYRDIFNLQMNMFLGIFIAYQLEFLKYFQTGIDLYSVLFFIVITIFTSILLSDFYVNYYKTNASYLKLYEVPLIILFFIPLGFSFLESSPDSSLQISSLYYLMAGVIPYFGLLTYRKLGIKNSDSTESNPKSKMEALQNALKRQLMDYVSDKTFVSFNKNYQDKIFDDLYSLDHKLSFSYFEGKRGIGKTSLVHLARKNAKDNIKFFYGDCDEFPESKQIPYEPFYQAFHENEFNEALSVQEGIFYSGKGNSTAFLRKASPALALLPGINLNSEALINSVSSFESELNEAKINQVVNELEEAILNAYCKKNQKIKLVLVLDDIQWMDELSLKLLFPFLEMISKLTQNQDELYFHLFCLKGVSEIEQSNKIDFVSNLERITKTWYTNDYRDKFDLNSNELMNKSFSSDFLNEVSKQNKLSFDFDLLQTIEDKISSDVMNARNSIEMIERLLDSDYVAIRDGFIVQVNQIDWSRISVVDREIESMFNLFNSLDGNLIKYLTSAAHIGMEFEARILSELWGINRLDLLHLLLDAEKRGIIFDKNDSDDFYVFSSKKMRSSLRKYISANKSQSEISQIVRDYHYALIKIELQCDSINLECIDELRNKSSFLLQRVAERCQYITDSHPDEVMLIFMIISIKLYEEGKFDKAHQFVEKIPHEAPLFIKYPILSQIRVSQIQNNSPKQSTDELEKLYNFLLSTLNKYQGQKEFDKKTLSEFLDKVLEFNLRCRLNQFDFKLIDNYPSYLHGLINWYNLLGENTERNQYLELYDSIFDNPEIADNVKGKYSNSILPLLNEKDQLKMISWRYCNICNIETTHYNSFNNLAQEICNLNIQGFTFQQTEDLCFLSGSIFRFLLQEKIENEKLNQFGQKRILLNQVIGSEFGEYLSTLDLLSAINDRDKTLDLFYQYKEFLLKNINNVSGWVIYIYIDLLLNLAKIKSERLTDNNLDGLNEFIKKYIEKQSFSIESITPKYLKEQTEKKINKLKTIQLHEDILSVINLVLK